MQQRFNVSIPKTAYTNIKHHCVDAGKPVQEAIREAIKAWCEKNNVPWIQTKN